jgi:hypothetical protein
MDSKNTEDENKMANDAKQSDKNEKFGYLGWLN